MAANYQHIGGGENRLGRHYSRFSAFWPPAALADQSLALRKSQNAGSNRRSRVRIYGEALRSWLTPEGIGVSVVLPGFVETRLSDTVSGPKPLILPPERAARIIRRGLAKGRRQIAFPYPLYLGMRLMRALPAGLVDPILRRVSVDIGPYA